MSPSGQAYVVVVPVKPPALGKSRMSELPSQRRIELARAFALDTVTAALGCPSVSAVLAVTDDFRFASDLADAGCAVLPDGVSNDLNGTLVQAALEAVRRFPAAGVAALCADLPALTSAQLESALEQAPMSGAGFVEDATGTGTTMYVARAIADFHPRFGGNSATAHRDSGALPLAGEWPGLRQDVDEVVDLGRVMLLGVGAHTRLAGGL